MPSSPTTIQLQPRDIELLIGLFESRLMTLKHAAAIHFRGNVEAAKKRIQKLKNAGFIAERPRRAYDPSILFLTHKSFVALTEGGYLDDYPSLVWNNLEKRARVSDLTLRHELNVMDFKAAMFTSIAGINGCKVDEFCTWPLLYEFSAAPDDGVRPMTVRPDGFARMLQSDGVGRHSEIIFYLEIDRSTEVLDTLVTRAQCYRDHYRRGGLAARFGRPREEFERVPFRVLVVLRNTERRNNLTERLLLLRNPILSQVWLTTADEAKKDPLGLIWVTPREYRATTATTLYTPRYSDQDVYRRNVDREAFVESAIQKQKLLGEITERNLSQEHN